MGPILKVKNLSKHFDVSPPLITRLVSREEKSILKAVEGIGFEIKIFDRQTLTGCHLFSVNRIEESLHKLSLSLSFGRLRLFQQLLTALDINRPISLQVYRTKDRLDSRIYSRILRYFCHTFLPDLCKTRTRH